MADMVTLTLAGPLNAARAEQLHAKEVKDYLQGDKITLPKGDAHAIIGAGYASGIDPADHEAVRDALNLPDRTVVADSTKAPAPKK